MLGSLAGLMVGFWEAGELFFIPSSRVFLSVDASYVVWFLVPLLDLALYGLLGACLGGLAVLFEKVCGSWGRVISVSLLFGAVGAHVGWTLHFLHTLAVNFYVFESFRSISFPLIRFGAAFVLALLLLSIWRSRVSALFVKERAWARRAAAAQACAIVVLLVGLGFYVSRQGIVRGAAQAGTAGSGSKPNIVLITMDTVRADHLSLYGYHRGTTPHIDRLATRGVVFTDAIAPVPWTLPSLASIFTGLAPHQHGADASRPLNLAYTTLAEALRQSGYETASFNANHYYAQAGWGIGQGYETYDDDTASLAYNFSRTLFARTVFQPLYQRVKHYDVFYRRDAGELNQDIFRWLKQSPKPPFFLYINYFDAHAPYIAPTPYDRRFGRISPAMIRASVSFEFRPAQSFTPEQRASLVDGYDDCLAYLDAEVGKLSDFLDKSSYGKNTIVILTADHGEAFGEHGAYGHGNDLHREEIHVPLIIWGPGIPAGRRVDGPAPVRGLFATAIDLAVGNALPFHPYSLARFWERETSPPGNDNAVITELSRNPLQEHGGAVSLSTSDWQYIRTAQGNEALYRWSSDPGEKHDLCAAPEYQRTLNMLRARLGTIIRTSVHPWLGPEYLVRLAPETAAPSSAVAVAGRASAASEPSFNVPPLGSAQDYLLRAANVTITRPTEQQKELLNSLPYH